MADGNTRPIFIFGAHKSGTSLVRALLDGHDDLYTIPIEAHLLQHLGYWTNYPYQRRLPTEATRAGFVESVAIQIGRVNRKGNPQADSVAFGMFDVPALKAALSRRLRIPETADDPLDLADCLEPYADSLSETFDGPFRRPGQRIVEKSVENFEFAHELKAAFPACSLVHVLRNPYANIVSLRKFKSVRGFPYLGHVLRAIHSSLYALEKNRRLIKDYIVVRYEDLVTSPKQVMQSLADQIGIEFTQGLLAPTVGGEPWKGNSTSAQGASSIVRDRVSAWQEQITSVEAVLLNRSLGSVIPQLGYEMFQPGRSVFRRIRRERPTIYLANRMLLKIVQGPLWTPV